MALNPVTLSAAIQARLRLVGASIATTEDPVKEFADIIAQEVYAWMLTATVVIPTGSIQVATVGTAAAQTGANTTPSLGNIT